MTILDWNIHTIIERINDHYKDGLHAINKRQSLEDIWELWGHWMLEYKAELEFEIYKVTSLQHLKWIYALLQNRNQLISTNLDTRLGKVGFKRELAKASVLMAQLITGDRKSQTPCEICEKVDQHILGLSTGNYDTVVKRKIYVKDYPKKLQYREPVAILTPKDIVIAEGNE